MASYDKSKYSRLKYKFNGAEAIEKNYSQTYQDMFVLTMLNGKKGGTYVEVGASDAIAINNTYLLESGFQWKGVSIDIEKGSQDSFLQRRFLKRVRKNTFILQDALTVDYEAVFKANGFGSQIDYLQLDIEPQAQTLNCLKKMPLDKYRFSVITYETDFYDPSVTREASLKNRAESRDILLAHGYELVAGNITNTSTDDPFEDWYVDPKVVDKKIIELFKASGEYNNTGETFLLTN